MEEQNNQNFEKQETDENKASESGKQKKPLSRKTKMAIIIGAAVAVIAIVIAIIIAFLGNGNREHTHNWRYNTTKDRTCTENGIMIKKCDVCGETTAIDLLAEHSYGDYQRIQANCIMEGKQARFCKVCGHEDSYAISARDSHSFWSDWTIVEEADCLTEGKRERKCYYCDEYEREIIPAQHKYLNGTCTVCNRGLLNFVLPDAPIIVHDFISNDLIDETCKITSIELKEIEYRNGKYTITFVWSGEKTYDNNGDNYSSSVGFAYKIYDSEGFVVYSSQTMSVAVKVGEKFRNEEFTTVSLDIDPDEQYTMEILNLD